MSSRLSEGSSSTPDSGTVGESSITSFGSDLTSLAPSELESAAIKEETPEPVLEDEPPIHRETPLIKVLDAPASAAESASQTVVLSSVPPPHAAVPRASHRTTSNATKRKRWIAVCVLSAMLVVVSALFIYTITRS
jgi:hypothetical protein